MTKSDPCFVVSFVFPISTPLLFHLFFFSQTFSFFDVIFHSEHSPDEIIQDLLEINLRLRIEYLFIMYTRLVPNAHAN